MRDGVMRVVKAVASYEDERPENLPPLQGVIEADCLDHFFLNDTNGLVQFEYCGYEVTYHADGEIELGQLR